MLSDEAEVIVLVDLHTWDLADSEMSIFNNKKILEVTRVDGWQDIVSDVQGCKMSSLNIKVATVAYIQLKENF